MVELVWDEDRLGTATGQSGISVSVGEAAHFSPDELLATAAASCLMRTFLRMADEAGIEVLGYSANAKASPACEADAAPAVAVHVYIVAPTEDARAGLLDLAGKSVRVSPIARLLGERLEATAEVRVLARPSET